MKKKREKHTLKAIDFFCGAGGMTQGMRQAGIKVIAGIDIEEEYKKTYKANNGRAKYLVRDITKYKPEQLCKELGLERLDDRLVFVGCSPCQYWSKMNTLRLNGSYTKNLLGDFQRFVGYFKPGYVLVENVPGIKKKQTNTVLLDFLDFLSLNDYKYEYRIINAVEFGVPQTRRRFVLIASRLGAPVEFPVSQENCDLTVRNSIGSDKGFYPIANGHIDKTEFMHTAASLSPKNLERIELTELNGGTRMAWANNPDLQIPTYVGKDDQFKNVYSRMFWDKPAPTITTRFNSLSNGRFGHPEQSRALSLREGATLQTFPKEYMFYGSKASIAKQIGNAVPPELAKRLGTAILQTSKKRT